MSLYHFDVEENGSIIHDEEGAECADFFHVKDEAASALAEMMKDAIPGGDHHRMSIRVRNDAGRMILHVAMNYDVESEDPHAVGRASSIDHHI